MPRTANDGPVLSTWLATCGRRSAKQYAIAIRPLLRRADPLTVSAGDVLAFALEQPTDHTRHKVVTALNAFFGDLMDRGVRPDDPARRLPERVQAARANQALRASFERAGTDRADYESARWSDVLAGLLSSVADGIKPLPASPVIRELEDALLAKLGPLTRERFKELMHAPILRS